MKPTDYLTTEDGHTLAIYRMGNPQKPKLVYLHGGPGGSISVGIKDYFDLNEWDIIAFDQRGCGNSYPFASLDNNTIQDSVKDIERLRIFFGVDSWTVFGGSYGTTLGLCYAIDYPQSVDNLVLRGVFLGRNEDIKWLYQEGASYFYPKEHLKFKDMISPEKQQDLVKAYYEIFTSQDYELKRTAAKVWSDWENSVVLLVPPTNLDEQPIKDSDISLALLECHYFANNMFWEDDNYILNNINRIKDIPTFCVHGRYDVDCRPSAAFELCNKMTNSKLMIAESSGHSGFEPETMRLLKDCLVNLSNKSV